ncbi:MAG: DUF2752 domain-containing protein [Butyrivibrio sp.]|nr:DUF2752 domain-containing protein [Butyrivibrio sp.]
MKKKKDFLIAISAIVIVYVIFHITGIGCPIKFLTGVSCLGCGTTRAWLALLRGDIADAFRFHPLFWVPIPAIVIIILKRNIPKKAYSAFIYLFFTLYLVVYVFRMLYSDGSVVSFEPRQSAIYKIITFF